MMKRTAAWIVTVLLIMAVAGPATAGSFVGDLVQASNANVCGKVVVSTKGTIVIDLNYSSTGSCTPPSGKTVGVGPKFGLCIWNVSEDDGAYRFKATLTDANGDGRIKGAEGVVTGALGPASNFSRFEIVSTTNDCTGTVEYRSGWKRE